MDSLTIGYISPISCLPALLPRLTSFLLAVASPARTVIPRRYHQARSLIHEFVRCDREYHFKARLHPGKNKQHL